MRRRFLADRRAEAERRYDEVHSARYDENWGAISSTHDSFVRRLLELVTRGGTVLDAACGTGKYWPTLIRAGLQVVGVDQSAGMLAEAARKYPNVEIRRVPLQQLGDETDLRGRFDALLCVDALEFVGPEDWPHVVAALAGVLRPGGWGYVTVELRPPTLAAPADPLLRDGEDYAPGGGYHYYPRLAQVLAWLTGAGLQVHESAEGDCYWHALLARSRAMAGHERTVSAPRRA
jgi:SAM-dependent methyltransferase